MKVGYLYMVVGNNGHYFNMHSLVECIDSKTNLDKCSRFRGLLASRKDIITYQILSKKEVVEIGKI